MILLPLLEVISNLARVPTPISHVIKSRGLVQCGSRPPTNLWLHSAEGVDFLLGGKGQG